MPRSSRSRVAQIGQSLAEFALVLPILLILVFATIDFGRAFFGWVTLNNMARVGANYAALHPGAWGTPGNTAEQDEYKALMLASADRLGCTLNPAPTNPPPPTFGAAVTPGDPNAWANVALTCDFQLIAPGIRQILGSSIRVVASSTFPITYGCIAACGAVPAPTAPPTVDNCRTVPTMSGLSVAGARRAWTSAGFTGVFSPSPGTFDTQTVDVATITPPADADPCGTGTAFFAASVSVSLVPLATPPPTPTCVYVPNLTGMTVAEGRTAWAAAGFTGAYTPPTDPAINVQIITSQVTTPSAAVGACVEPPAVAVAVTYVPPPPAPPAAPCKVPSLVNTASGAAQGTWTGSGFTGALTFDKPNKLPYQIKTQSLVGGTYVVCGATMEVAP